MGSSLSHAEAETPILWPPDAKNWLIWKDPDPGKDWRQKKGMTEDEMVGWHHCFDGHEFEQALEVGDGQRSLACCSPWGCRVGPDWMTELNWTESHHAGLNFMILLKPNYLSKTWFPISSHQGVGSQYMNGLGGTLQSTEGDFKWFNLTLVCKSNTCSWE